MSEGGSANKILPILVCRVSRNVEQGRAAIDQVMEVRANSGVNTVRLRHLNKDQELTSTHTDALHRELTASRSEVRELRKSQVALERRVWETEN